MTYRPDIDGLRGIAVLSVMFFHADFSIFEGGYIGVDIFFVISGFLITNLILNEIKNGKFRLQDFYLRRARRLFPALFLTIFFCFPFIFFIFTPPYIEEFGESLIYVIFFLSNIYFWLDVGYFSFSAELKPLLHTWSLAVEEQFYILFPIFFLFILQWGVKRITYLLILILLFSFFISEWGVMNNKSSTFYLLPTRGWEILLGALASIYLLNKKSFKHNKTREIISIFGLLMIGFSLFVFDNNTPFPGKYTLIPTLGTVLIIIASTKRTFVHKLLCIKPLIYTGLISYSLYLFHYPILAFYKYTSFDDMNELILVLICIGSIFIAYASWKFVEMPFRNKNLYKSKTILSVSFICILIISLIGLTMYKTNGLEKLKINYDFNKLENKNYKIISKNTDYIMEEYIIQKDCIFWNEDINKINQLEIKNCFKKYSNPLVIIGDSHALNIHNIFSKSNNFNFIISIAKGGCRPYKDKIYDNCHYANILEYLKHNIYLNPNIIYHQSGEYLIHDKSMNFEPDLNKEIYFYKEGVTQISKYLKKFQKFSNKIIWLGPHINYGLNPSMRVIDIPNIPHRNFMVSDLLNENIIENIPEKSPFNFLRFDEFYKLTKKTFISDCLIWKDSNHFSKCGELIISKESNFSFFY